MDWSTEFAKGTVTLIAVLVGGMMAWRAGLNMRVEDSIRQAYADLGAAWEVYLHAVQVHTTAYWRHQQAGGLHVVGRASGEPEDVDEAKQTRLDRYSALLACWQKALMLDKSEHRRAFLRTLISDSREATGWMNVRTGQALVDFTAGLDALRARYDEFRESLPHHFTSLGIWAADD